MEDSATASNKRQGWLPAICLGILIVGALPVFLSRVQSNKGCDFPEFWAAGRYILDHGVRQADSLLYRYLPSVDAAWIVFGWMPLSVAAVLYYTIGCLIWLGLLRTIGACLLPAVPQADRYRVLWIAGALTIVFTLGHLMLGAFHLLMIWLLVAGLSRILRGNPFSGACLLGTAIWLKLLPLLAVPYLLLKRRYKAAGLSVLVAIVLDVALSVAAYGPSGARAAHVDWWHGHAVGDLHSLLASPQAVSDQRDRNQSLAAVMRRTLTRMGTDPAEAGKHGRGQLLMDLSPAQLKLAYFAVAGLAAVLLAWFWRRPARALNEPRQATEIATVALATLWFSPILFSYHPVAALPALAILVASRPERRPLKYAALATWILATLLLAIPQARVCGEILWASGLLGIALVATGNASPETPPGTSTASAPAYEAVS